jgi:hypothetical protein
MKTTGKPYAVLCCILALLVPGSAMSAQNAAAVQGAVLTPSGMVSINGQLVNKPMTLLGDESISTGPDSGAQITAAGFNTLLASGTVASFSKDSIQLKSGSLRVSSSTGTAVQVGSQRFAPADPGKFTRFEVQSTACEVVVTAQLGNVILPDGKILNRGQSFNHIDDNCGKSLAEEHHIPKAVWIAAGTAAAAAAGIALLETGGSSSHAAAVSPAAP